MYNNQKPISVLIIEDHLLMLEGLKSLLAGKPEVSIAGSFAKGLDGLAFLERQRADVVLLDVNLPDVSGIELCARIKQLDPSVKILALSAINERAIILQMLQNGAGGYVLKNTSPAALLDAIKQVLNQRIVLSPDAQETLATAGERGALAVPKLTRREKDVLQLIAKGLTNPQIAATLHISPLTAETHRKNIMQKLKVNNAAALIRAAMDLALL